MIAAVLASYLATQAWGWTAVPGADGYYLYWTTCCSAQSCFWPQSQSAIIGPEQCVTGECQGEVPNPPDEGLVFFVVTAFNEAGEGSTEHGAVGPCP